MVSNQHQHGVERVEVFTQARFDLLNGVVA